MSELHKVPFNLQYFADGGAAGATGGEGGAEGAAPAVASQPTQAKTKYSGVRRYGQQPADIPQAPPVKEDKPEDAPAEKEQEPAPQADPDAEFDDLIKNKYKEQWQKRADSIAKDRHAKWKAAQEQLDTYTSFLTKVAARYGVDPTDINAAMAAFESDKAYIRELAEKEGRTVEEMEPIIQLRQEKAKADAELARIKAEQERIQQEQRSAETVQRWRMQEAEAKQRYPDCDVLADYNHPDPQKRAQFRGMLHSGLFTVEQAYKAIHAEELAAKAAAEAEKAAKAKLAAEIQARGSRPAENGTSGQVATVPPFDPSVLTERDIQEMRRLAREGQHFTPEEYYARKMKG